MLLSVAVTLLSDAAGATDSTEQTNGIVTKQCSQKQQNNVRKSKEKTMFTEATKRCSQKQRKKMFTEATKRCSQKQRNDVHKATKANNKKQ